MSKITYILTDKHEKAHKAASDLKLKFDEWTWLQSVDAVRSLRRVTVILGPGWTNRIKDVHALRQMKHVKIYEISSVRASPQPYYNR